MSRRFATIAAALLATSFSLTPAAAQRGDPENAARLDALKTVMKDKKMSRDAEAVQVLGELGADFERLDKSDRKKVVRAVTAVLTSGRLRPPDKSDAYLAATFILTAIGDLT